MEFNEKLQELRKRKGVTQQELADSLYVSRTAVSKWESGRGYPSIESLKALARFFSVTVDELLSTDEALTIAEQQQKRTQEGFVDLVLGLLDACSCLLVFLPFFVSRADGVPNAASLATLENIPPYLKIAYFAVVLASVVFGILTLAMQSCQRSAWIKSKTKISFALGAISVLLFIVSLQTYAATFAFILLAIKGLIVIKKR